MLTVGMLALLQVSQDPVAAEVKARADLLHAVQHVDELLLLASKMQDHARQAQQLASTTAQTATTIDRARLARVAGDLAEQLAALRHALARHSEAIGGMRVAFTAELPERKEGTVPWFREQLLATSRLPTHREAITALRKLERDVQADAVKAQPGADGLLSHARIRLVEAMRSEANRLARSDVAAAVGLLGDSLKKLDEVLGGADAADSGEASSLHALALGRKVEIHSQLYVSYDALARQKPAEAAKAEKHRKGANDAFERLQRAHGDATLPNGQRIVDAAFAAIGRLR